ncbi:unnamed protein product [Caenorhabditis nigoni]
MLNVWDWNVPVFKTIFLFKTSEWGIWNGCRHIHLNLRIDDVLTLNAERIYLHTDHISLRDLTRFFKLWKKGSNPRLEELTICWRTQIIPNWKMFRNELKGRRIKAVSQRWKKFRITNCRAVRANINCKLFGGHLAFVQFISK